MSVGDPRTTPLLTWHREHGARLVTFGGWLMPLQYRSITEEHQAVRQRVGLFDISHMGRLTFSGDGALEWVERLTTNHAARLEDGQIQYSLMVDDAGGLIDDLLVYRNPFGYTVVCNAGNREAVVEQFLARRPASVPATVLADRTADTAMIALQGPMALEVLQPLTACALAGLRYYHATMGQVAGAESVISRTGYTGEDGFELIVAAAKAVEVWDRLMAQGASASILPCGLGARDTLRFEAAMPLYGHELDRTVNPYEAGLAWAVKPAKGEFVGRQALRDAQTACGRARVGLALPGKRIARQGFAVLDGDRTIGVVTSGTYAITLQRSLAMALVESQAATPGTPLAVDIRGTREPAEVVPLPFYRRDRYLSSGLGRTT